MLSIRVMIRIKVIDSQFYPHSGPELAQPSQWQGREGAQSEPWEESVAFILVPLRVSHITMSIGQDVSRKHHDDTAPQKCSTMPSWFTYLFKTNPPSSVLTFNSMPLLPWSTTLEVVSAILGSPQVLPVALLQVGSYRHPHVWPSHPNMGHLLTSKIFSYEA